MADDFNPNDLGDSIRRSVEQAVSSINTMVGQIIGTGQSGNQQQRQQNTQIGPNTQNHTAQPMQPNSVSQAAQQVRTQFDAVPKYPATYAQPVIPQNGVNGTQGQVPGMTTPGAYPQQQGGQPSGTQIRQMYINPAYRGQVRQNTGAGQTNTPGMYPPAQQKRNTQGAAGQRGRGLFGGAGGTGGNQNMSGTPMVETNTHINDPRYPDYMRTSRPAPVRVPNQPTPMRVTRKAEAFPGEEETGVRSTVFLVFTILSGLFSFGMLGEVMEPSDIYIDEVGILHRSEGVSVIVLLLTLGVFGLFLFLFLRSKKKKKQYARFREYIKRYATKPEVSIIEMSAAMGLEPSVVRDDWKRMIELGIFPQGHFGPGDQVIFLSNEGYEKYMQAYGLQTGKTSETAGALPAPEGAATGTKKHSAEVEKALEQGRSYLLQLRNENDAIPGEAVSQKLDLLEDVCKRIFRVVEEHPEKLPEIRKFMEYYMPTTLKLVHTYREFEDQKLEGDNITRTKKDIEDTLDMINVAFENLLNDLFKDAAVEASADISVLNALFAQEGLKEKEFEVVPRK